MNNQDQMIYIQACQIGIFKLCLTVGEFLIVCPLSIIADKAELILKLNTSLG